ncbi:MAG: APC family permease [Neisseriaceae bacterium]
MSNHKIKLTTLILSGLGAIIGSGWLFGAAQAAKVAGPASIFSWIIGASMVLVIALNLVEISSIAPIRMGSMGYFLRYTHGSFASFLAEWTILIGFASSVPSEATASTQYLSDWNFEWAHNLFDHATNSLTTSGMIVSSLLCIVYFLINYYSLAFLAKSIKALTFFKVAVPIIAIVSFIAVGFNPSNLHIVGDHSLAPYGISGIFTAVTTAGVVYAFNGFQAPITFASESDNPKRNLPLALIGSILIATLLYIGLQVTYLTSMPQDLLLKYGWHGLNFSSPFASLALALNMNLIAILLFADAFVSPSGAGIIYTSLTGRVICGMEEHMPKIVGKLDPVTKLPRNALITVLILSFIALWLLPSWDKLAAVISVGYVLCYATVPVSTYSFRKLSPTVPHDKAIRVYGMKLLSPLGFILATFMLYWSRWPLNGEVIFIVFLGIPLYMYYAIKSKEKIMRQIPKTIWIIAYLIFVALYGYIGGKDFGGLGIIPNQYCIDHLILAACSLVFFIWGVSVSYKTDEYIDKIDNFVDDKA